MTAFASADHPPAPPTPTALYPGAGGGAAGVAASSRASLMESPFNAGRDAPAECLAEAVQAPRAAVPGINYVMDGLLSRITIDPAVCHGKPCIRGLRYPVETLLELLSSGMTFDEILADYEDLERDDLLAALAFAARLARTRQDRKSVV